MSRSRSITRSSETAMSPLVAGALRSSIVTSNHTSTWQETASRVVLGCLNEFGKSSPPTVRSCTENAEIAGLAGGSACPTCAGERLAGGGAGASAQCRLLCSAKPVHSGYSCEPPCWLLLGEITPAGPYGSWVTWPVLRLGEFALSDAANH